MRYGVFGDIHGNLEALDIVIEAMRRERVDRFLCLGDIVGYGANPSECIARVRALDPVVVIGNHDLAAVGMLDISAFNPFAREAVLWCRQALGPEDLAFLEQPNLVEIVNDTVTIFHASLALPEQFGYIQTPEEAAQSFAFLKTRVGFFGHSHVPVAFSKAMRRIELKTTPELSLVDGISMLVNPGSVGQPRDGDSRAAFAVYDADAGTITCRRVRYDVERAQAKIREAGLPPIIWERLSQGI